MDNSYRRNRRVNDTFRGPHDHWSQICRCDFICSISAARFCRSISSARSRSLHLVRRISSPDRSLPLIHLLSHRIYSPVQLRSTPGLGAHSILYLARLTASVSAHATVFSIRFSVSQPDRHNDARASPLRIHLIYTAPSPDLLTASASSLRRFLQFAALFLRCHLRPRLPRSPLCCSVQSPRETGFSCSKRRGICGMNADS
jgi:hypothetical protein